MPTNTVAPAAAGHGRAVLVIDDEDTLARNLAVYLRRHGYEVQTAGSAEEGMATLPRFRPDVVLLDHNLPGLCGLDAIEPLQRSDPQLRIVLITGFGGTDVMSDALRRGAADCLTKPVSLCDVRRRLERIDHVDRLQRALQYHRDRDAANGGFDAILGRSPAVETMRAQLRRLIDAERGAAPEPPPAVLIEGETGAGKRLAARALHLGGRRGAASFVECDGSAPAERLMVALFGSDGDGDEAPRRGLVDAAAGGTLYLTALDDAPAPVQQRLSVLLARQRFGRVGGVREQRADVRLIAAMQRPLHDAVRDGRVDAGLGERLAAAAVGVPPLRARGDDVAELAGHFLALSADRHRRHGVRLSSAAQAALRAHDWPGNVRELRHAIERALLLSPGSDVELR